MQRQIDVDLEPEDALDHVAARFVANRGWTIAREPGQLRVVPSSERGHVFDPIPSGHAPLLPETLCLRVTAAAHPGGRGARITARIGRTNLWLTAGTVTADLLFYSFGFASLLHLGQMVEYRRERRGGKRRLLRLAIEPLLPFELGPDHGPFRGRTRGPGRDP